MDQRLETLQRIETNWPLPAPDGKMYYDDFYEQMHCVSVNHICVSCACIHHSPADGSTCLVDIDLLKLLQINADEVVPLLFFCGVESLDAQSIMINKLGPSPWIASQLLQFLRVTADRSGWLLSSPRLHVGDVCRVGNQSTNSRELTDSRAE